MEPFPVNNLKIGGVFDIGSTFTKDSVIDFMATPVLIRTVTVNSSDVANTTLATIVLPFDQNNLGNGTDVGQGMMTSRLNAYLGFRGTAILRFQINCNRFAQGRLLIHYIPGQNDSPNDTKAHRFNLMTKSQNPRTEINLNRDTSSVFRVPYVSANGAYDLTSVSVNSRIGKMGDLYITVYSPLVGTSSLTIQCFLHFEDVELIIPTYYPQMNTADNEERRQNTISGGLKTISTAVGLLGRIPALTSLAGPASWFLDASSKAARAFGYSKPNNEKALTRVSQVKNPYALNCDGEDESVKLGWSMQNKVDVLPGFAGNNIDEMSLEYICNRPSWVGTAPWASSAVSGDTITSYQCTNDYHLNTTIGLANVWTAPPFSYVSYFFQYWRMDLVFTFKIVKTEFHTGKLLFTFRPTGPQGATAPTLDQSNYLSREILDIRESDTFIITVPYSALTPYLNQLEFFGRVDLKVFVPLNAPVSVSSTVQVITEISAKNVMFSCPSRATCIPVTGSTPEFTPQMNMGDSEFAPREKLLTVGGLRVPGVNLNSARYCVGEEIVSIKQLLLRKCPLYIEVLNFSTVRSVSFRPFVNGGGYYDGTNWTYHPMTGGYYSAFACLYVLARGGMRYRAMIALNTTNMNIFMGYYGESIYPGNGDDVTTSSVSGYTNNTDFVQSANPTGNLCDFEVPHSSYTHSREIETKFQNDGTSGPLYSLGTPRTRVRVSTFTGVSWNRSNLQMYQGVADDFQLGFFIGVPSFRLDDNFHATT